MRYTFYVVQRVIGTSLPEYMDQYAHWCGCLVHSKMYDTREEAQWTLTCYLRDRGAEMIQYSVTEQEQCDY